MRLRLAGAPGEQLYLEITNPLPSTRRGPLVPGSGLGLAGLTERAALSGGSLNHGITADERFRVRAWLPWPAEDEGHS